MPNWNQAIENIETKERELSKRHEEILKRREALLRGTEAFFNTKKDEVDSYLIDFRKARDRNEELIKKLNETVEVVKQTNYRLAASNFTTLRSNYYTMVSQMFPLWFAEQRDYEQRHPGYGGPGPSPRRSRSPRVHSGRRSVTPTPRSRSAGSPDWSLEDTARSMTDVPRTRHSSDDVTLSEAVSEVKQAQGLAAERSPSKGKASAGSPRKQRTGGHQVEVDVEVHALDASNRSPTHRKRKTRVSYNDNN